MKITETNENEFWYHVADQDEIPIAGEVDRFFDVDTLFTFLAGLPEEDLDFDDYLLQSLLKNMGLVDILRAIVGVSDKRMYLELSYLFGRTPRSDDRYIGVSGDSVFNLNSHALQFFKNLAFTAKGDVAESAQKLFVQYFKKKRLLQSAKALSKLQKTEVVQIVESLIITKEVQQKEAKRRGHGAEFALATTVHNLGCEMLPVGRHLNAMAGRDPNVNMTTFEEAKKERGKTWSTDLIVLDKKQSSRIFIQSLIHTSDPGQYGVNKSDETVQIKKTLTEYNRVNAENKELWGLVDGVGFTENKSDTIDKMIKEFDCFVQIKTLYKAGLKLHRMGLTRVHAIRFNDHFYKSEESDAMFAKYGSNDIKVLNTEDLIDPTWIPIEAGMATLYR